MNNQDKNISHLCLSRKAGESIKIGEDIVVHIHRLKNGSARVGVEAPKDVTILRTELIKH